MISPKILLTTDLHLSERNDEQYRFGIFSWIAKKHGENLDAVIIAGDLTDRKNYHADWFVNKIVDSFRRLSKTCPIYILKGNHDYDTNPDEPFFRFLDEYRRITYVCDPEIINIIDTHKVLMLPHTRRPAKDWGILDWKDLEPDFIVLHQTFKGARAESGIKLDGLDTRLFRKYDDCLIFSGDIHVPQNVGPIIYIGCPYHIHYGDNFAPGVILLDDKLRLSEDYFPAPQKLVLDIVTANSFSNYTQHQTKHKPIMVKGDWVKVRLHLPRSEFGKWESQRDKIRKLAKKIGVNLHSVVLKEIDRGQKKSRRKRLDTHKTRSRLETFDAYCDRYKIEPDLQESGKELMSN